ncbi:MAG TPA: prealbumin-like fold domain-containing protein, partial [Dehalococcoidia bacterium]|nr:prealbumin-like fold domain-containing protein [Dehalococcoidia bacterium]
GRILLINVPCGDYTITETEAPEGYVLDPDSQTETVSNGQTATFSFTNSLSATGPFRTIGFWKHQFSVSLFGRGDAQVSKEELINYLDYICTEYPDSDTLYESLCGTNQKERFLAAYKALSTSSSMEEKAKQQYLATLLNLAANPDDLNKLVDTNFDGIADMVFKDAIDLVQGILLDPGSTSADFEHAKDICDSINNMHE